MLASPDALCRSGLSMVGVDHQNRGESHPAAEIDHEPPALAILTATIRVFLIFWSHPIALFLNLHSLMGQGKLQDTAVL